MKRFVERFGKLITASFIIIAIGAIAFLLTPVLYGRWGIDSDLPGILTVFTGLAVFLIGIIRRKKLHGWKLIVLTTLTVILLLPMVMFIVSLLYYLITGKELGG